jgi:ABC-type tungstate transport system permease subunit
MIYHKKDFLIIRNRDEKKIILTYSIVKINGKELKEIKEFNTLKEARNFLRKMIKEGIYL